MNWFKVLLYLSILFLCLTLYRADYLVLPKIHSFLNIWISILLLFTGFLFMCDNWRVVLQQDEVVNISFKDAIISNGLSVFAKYIPGKVMVIIGRALYIGKKYSLPTTKLSFISFKVQIMTLWIGLSIGMISIMKLNPRFEIIVLLLMFLLFSAFFLFSKGLKELTIKSIKRIFRRDIDYPLLTPSSVINTLPSFILNWISWCAAFYFLIVGLTNTTIPILAGTSFAMASTLAIIAIIAPGGLGIREGILAAVLIGFGIEKSVAISISVASRLWFLIGEIFIFTLAYFLEKSFR